ncbi:MAG: NUDIX domain-containing protein [Endomicrobia bacterium]|nr:NUDIX domain-containing protein [Endomicrobiia bacterium]MCL2507145.1 NUDIX domain-containing protein [Endomicrobiia bacterium]
MLKEFSFGAVLYKICEGEPLFLLVRSKRNGKWGFPKGHIEKGESEIETARREVFEETGIKNIEFVESFRQEDIYIIDGTLPETKGKITEKHSVFFLAKALEEPSKNSDEEISETGWFSLQDALNVLAFENQKETIKKAYEKTGGANE